jgi:acetolactate synthase-1/2/3 large subunit
MQNYKPVILIGNGIRNNPALIEHLCSLNIPVLTTWMAADLLPEDHPVYCGRPGIFGQRAANIIQQKATHLYCFGARLDGEQVAYAYDRFAPNAVVCVYDIDDAELGKFPDRFIKVDADFMKNLQVPDSSWLVWCRALYARFRPELDGCDEGDKYVDPFTFTRLLSEHSKSDDVFAIGSSGNAPTVFFQAYKVKAGQRVSNVCTIGAMGADIPMAMGAALATGRRTICVTGDGGFQMNAQELETIRRLRLPVIFFVMNNNGYNSIRVAQKARFGRVTGADPASGLTLPSIESLAEAYRFVYMQLRGKDLPNFARALGFAPMIVEVFVDPAWQQLPRVMASTVNGQLRTDDMERMFPYLPDDELKEIMEY